MARAAVLRNLAMLPERSRGLLYLLFLADVTTYADIADLLDIADRQHRPDAATRARRHGPAACRGPGVGGTPLRVR